MSLGLLFLTIFLIALYFINNYWFFYLYYVVGIYWSVFFSVTYLVSEPVEVKDNAILIILVVLCVLGCSQLLLYFYRASTKFLCLKKYALEYIVFTIIIIGCFALNYESINQKAYIYLEAYQKEPTLENAVQLNQYLNRFGLISEQSNLELHKALLEKPTHVSIQNLYTKNNFFDMFYFSTVSYLTVGYGDYIPTGWLVRSLVLLEVFVGHISTAILLVVGIAKFVKNH
ncbi:MAG: potassium channel family protein [Zhaonellaceae bacterium]|jgi:hypothetical protein|nr:two pore domain potassium channel family protein [Clostridia bacterium]